MISEETGIMIKEAFETAILPMTSVISGTLIPSESWVNNSADVVASRFVVSCRDFYCLLQRVCDDSDKIGLSAEFQDLLDYVLLEYKHTNSTEIRVKKFNMFGHIPKLSKSTMKKIQGIANNTVRSLDSVIEIIKMNSDEEIADKLRGQIGWIKLSLTGCYI